MKLREELVVTEMAGEHIVVPVGSFAGELHGVIRLNETAYFIWQRVEEKSPKEIAHEMTDFYEVDFETALAKVQELLEQMRRAGVLQGD